MPINHFTIGTLFYGITKSVGSIFASVGKITLVYKIPLFSAISNVILNFVLIPIYGINGGAIATTISLIVSTALMVYFMKSLVDIKINFIWYVEVLCLSGVLLLSYVPLKSLINNIILGSVLITLEVVLFVVYFTDNQDKNTILNLFNLSHSTQTS